MTIQQLEYIVALDTYRHFVTAAKKCFVTQPTITIQVKKLEDEIGFQIFDRSNTPFTTTPNGQKVLQKARMILQEIKQMKEMISGEKESMAGTFRIGVIPTIAPYVIPKFSGGFSDKHRDTVLIIDEMQSHDIMESLKNGRIDIGLLVTPLNEANLREIKLYDEPFVFFANKENQLLKESSINISAIEQLENLWLLKSGHCFRDQALNICKNYQPDNNIQFQSGSIETLKDMVKIYGGFTVVPEMALNKSDHGHWIPFSESTPIREVSIVVHKNFAKESLIDNVRKEILNIIPSNFEKNERYFRVEWR